MKNNKLRMSKIFVLWSWLCNNRQDEIVDLSNQAEVCRCSSTTRWGAHITMWCLLVVGGAAWAEPELLEGVCIIKVFMWSVDAQRTNTHLCLSFIFKNRNLNCSSAWWAITWASGWIFFSLCLWLFLPCLVLNVRNYKNISFQRCLFVPTCLCSMKYSFISFNSLTPYWMEHPVCTNASKSNI